MNTSRPAFHLTNRLHILPNMALWPQCIFILRPSAVPLRRLLLTHPAVTVAADFSGDWSWDDPVLSRVSVIWHQGNTANCTTQRYTIGVVITVRLDHSTTQSPHKAQVSMQRRIGVRASWSCLKIGTVLMLQTIRNHNRCSVYQDF